MDSSVENNSLTPDDLVHFIFELDPSITIPRETTYEGLVTLFSRTADTALVRVQNNRRNNSRRDLRGNAY